MFVMVSQMMMNMETNLIAFFGIENETCVDTCKMKCLDSIDDVLMKLRRRMTMTFVVMMMMRRRRRRRMILMMMSPFR